MATLLKKRDELKVTTNVHGIPLTVTRNGKAEFVTRVYQHWRVFEQLSGYGILKEYFRVKLGKSIVCDICRDFMSNTWYLDKIYD